MTSEEMMVHIPQKQDGMNDMCEKKQAYVSEKYPNHMPLEMKSTAEISARYPRLIWQRLWMIYGLECQHPAQFYCWFFINSMVLYYGLSIH